MSNMCRNRGFHPIWDIANSRFDPKRGRVVRTAWCRCGAEVEVISAPETDQHGTAVLARHVENVPFGGEQQKTPG